jgi:NAD(P) transhydrogenase subunit alpha
VISCCLLLLFLVAAVLGYYLLSRVPPLLHTPLMSGMNALSGITLVGALAATAAAAACGSRLLAACAVMLATINVVGGILVTDRMLRMFKGSATDKEKKK